MATTVDTLLVRVEADLKDVNQKLARFDKQVDNTAKKAGRNFQKISNIAKVALGAVIVHQFAQAGMAAVRFASSVEEMQAKSSVVFGAFTGEVRQALDAFGNEVGRSTFELEGMAASIQDTFVPMGFARGEAAKLSVELTKLAVDVASFNNASDTETMAAFQSALVGNHETVRRFGIVITEATLQQELYRMGITKNAQDVDNATKVQARMNLILAGTTDAQGDAARTSDSFANTSKALKAALDELLVNVVTPLLPALTSLARGLVNVTNNLNNFLQSIGLIEAVGLDTANALGQIAQKQGEINEQTRLMAEAQAKLDAESFKDLQSFLQGDFSSQRGLIKEVEAAREAIARLKSEQEDLATVVVADSFAAADVSTGGDDSLTKGQIKAAKKVTDALEDQRFRVKQLEDEMLGATEAELAFAEAKRELTAASKGQLDHLEQLIKLEFEHKKSLAENAEFEKKQAEAAAQKKENDQKIIDTIKELTIAQEELVARNNGVTEAHLEAEAVLRDLIGVEAEQEKQIRKIIQEMHDYEAQIEATKAANDNFVASVDRGRAFVEGLSDKQRELELVLADVSAAYGINSEEFAKAQAQIKHEIEMLDPMFKQQMEAVQSMSRGMSDAFADMLMSGKFNMDSLRDVFSSFVKTMLSKALELMVFNQIMNRVFNLSGPAALPTASFGASAGGGRVQGPTLVGERGPELFVPSSAGVIKNNHDTKNMLGQSGAVVNQSITIDAGVSQTVRAEIMTMMPVFKQQALEAVVESRRRGGQVASAFGR